MKNSLVMLVGSGASACVGMPGVETITKEVLAGTGVIRHTDGCYYSLPSRNCELARTPVEQTLYFLYELKIVIDRYFEVHWPGRLPNYEDFAELCHQIDDAIGFDGCLNFEDPALVPLIERLVGTDYPGCERPQLLRLQKRAREGWHYVSDCVRGLLKRVITDTSHLAAITNGCADERFGRVTLATLNHDLVLDRALKNAKIAFSDGFNHTHGDVRVWNDQFDDDRVLLLKLHGSVNWYARRLPGEEWREQITIADEDDVEHVRGPRSEDLGFTTDGRPEFLTGTFTKILSYDRRIYPEQHFRFYEALRQSNRVLVVGYGLRDRAINSRLMGWLDRSLDNKIVIVEPDVTRIERGARGAIRRNWEGWRNADRVRVIEKKIEDTEWNELYDMLE